MSSWPEISLGSRRSRGRKLGPSTCRFCRKCISVNALRTDVCFEDAWGLSMGLRRTGLGPRSHWRLCLRGTAKEFVRLRCVIRRRCGQALILNVVVLQATSVLLPSLNAENSNDTDAYPSRMLLPGRLPVIALPVSFRQNDPVPGQ